jgi:ribonuclease HI
MKNVTLHSDGACEGNPGSGGWATILTYQQHSREISGGIPATTNNRMELQAAVEGLKALMDSMLPLMSGCMYLTGQAATDILSGNVFSRTWCRQGFSSETARET